MVIGYASNAAPPRGRHHPLLAAMLSHEFTPAGRARPIPRTTLPCPPGRCGPLPQPRIFFCVIGASRPSDRPLIRPEYLIRRRVAPENPVFYKTNEAGRIVVVRMLLALEKSRAANAATSEFGSSNRVRTDVWATASPWMHERSVGGVSPVVSLNAERNSESASRLANGRQICYGGRADRWRPNCCAIHQ